MPTHDSLFVNVNDGFLKKLISFYRMGKVSADVKDLSGIKRIVLIYSVIKKSFKFFNLAKYQELLLAKHSITVIKMVNTQIDLNERGIAHTTSPNLEYKKEDAAIEEYIKNMDTKNMPRN